MPLADDLLRNMTPERKRQLAENLSRAGAWISTLATQIASQGYARPAEVVPAKAPPEAPSHASPALEADIQAIMRSGLPDRVRLCTQIRLAYSGMRLDDDAWQAIAHAVRLGGDASYANIMGRVDAIGDSATHDAPSHNSQGWARKRWLQMPREHYDYIRDTPPESGSRALMMASTYQLPSDAVAVEYNDQAGIAYVTHPSFEPVEPGKPVPMMQRRINTDATIP